MARIRSVHPGLWTDEAFVTVSLAARLFAIGLWNECDDRGAFEWKPITLKMRLLPMDNVDPVELLAELVAEGIVAKYTIENRNYGAVRNFCRFQKPKKPNYSHPMPDEIRTYVGQVVSDSERQTDSARSGSEPTCVEPARVPNDAGASSEPVGNLFSLEKEEGRGEGEDNPRRGNPPSRARETGTRFEPARSAPARSPSSKTKKYAFEAQTIRLTERDYEAWVKAFPNLSLDAELWALDEWAGKQKSWFNAVSATLAKKNREMAVQLECARNGHVPGMNGNRSPTSDAQILLASSKPAAHKLQPESLSEEEWRKYLTFCRGRGSWWRALGGAPFEDGCLVPPGLLQDSDRNLGATIMDAI